MEEVRSTSEELARELQPPEQDALLVKMLKDGDFEGAAAAAKEDGGPGLFGPLYCPARTLAHEACRLGGKKALGFLKDLSHDAAIIGVNDLGLTPFDYLTHTIDF